MSLGLTRLKHVVALRAGGTPSVAEPRFWAESEEGVAWVSIGDMSDGCVVIETERKLTEDGVRDRRLDVAPPGTLLFAMYASVGAVAELGIPATWNQALLGLRPHPGLAETRFVRYWLQHLRPSLAGIVRSNTQDNLNAEQVGNFPFPTLPVAHQRAIADLLDTETSRIDALITKKRRMTDLLEERSAGAVEAAVRAMVASEGDVPLKRRVEAVTVGIVVTPSEWYADEGVPALRGVNIRPGTIDTKEVVYLTDEGHRFHLKSALRRGDVVVVRTGQAGAAAVVPPELDGANCVDLLLIRPGELDPDFLTLVLNSDWTQKHVERNSVGSIQSHFNVGALRELPVPASDLKAQRMAVEALRRSVSHLIAVCHKLDRQLSLLQEHRQALITAAVTGELAIPGAAA